MKNRKKVMILSTIFPVLSFLQMSRRFSVCHAFINDDAFMQFIVIRDYYTFNF